MPLDQTPALTLQRIHRLLRPLRASLTALRAELDQHSARQHSAAALAKPGPSKAKARGVNAAELDEDYTEGPRRKRSKVVRGSRLGQVKQSATQQHPLSSSPIRQQVINPSHPPLPNAVPPQTLQNPARSSSANSADAFDLATYLRNHSASPQLVAKATQLARCYSSILETIYTPIPPASKSRSSSRRPSPVPPAPQPAAPPGRTVPSLAELCARQIGIAIEDNVQLCVEEAGEMREASAAASQEQKRGGRRQSARLPSPDEEDATAFQDEWYAACPAHSLGHVLVEHATSIIVEGLEKAPLVVVNAMCEVALAARAEVEVSPGSAPRSAVRVVTKLTLRPPPPYRRHASGQRFAQQVSSP